MKLVTQDYGCGTSSSILDYNIADVVIVSETNYEHVFDIEDDLLFIGHDFLFFLWDNEEKFKKWMLRKDKWEHWVWCFERIDAIVPVWQQKGHLSLGIASKFCKRILACDEDDCDKYGFDWMPQWASRKFYDKRAQTPENSGILFSGQAGGPEYFVRNALLESIVNDDILSKKIVITNKTRSMNWDDYVDNLLKYSVVLNPMGILKALNTRAFETLYSGRVLIQHTYGTYRRHEGLLKDNPGVIFVRDFDDLKSKIEKIPDLKTDSHESFAKNSLFARMKSVGLTIK